MLLPSRRLLRLVALSVSLMSMSARADEAVTAWTREADRLGNGGANWRTLVIMHMAMHDALNAARPIYRRWYPPGPGEPQPNGALPEAAMAAAAGRVLSLMHPDHRAEIQRLSRYWLGQSPPGPGLDAGVALGEAIGTETLNHRAFDGFEHVYPFPFRDADGSWRPAPPDFVDSNTTSTKPYLFPTRDGPGTVPPPALGSPDYRRYVEEARHIGARTGAERTEAQTYAAFFWAYQSSQRGFIRLGATLLDQHPIQGGLPAQARMMSQLAAALADSAVLIWAEKEKYSYWRPVTALHVGGYGVAADPAWEPLIDTPPHPEYPSGHASDCFVGAEYLAAVFGSGFSPVHYVSPSALKFANTVTMGMGQHTQVGNLNDLPRDFPSFAAAADECALSRLWSGAHFRSADDEAHRVAHAIVARALASVPPLK